MQRSSFNVQHLWTMKDEEGRWKTKKDDEDDGWCGRDTG